jgi:hypothetical protein
MVMEQGTANEISDLRVQFFPTLEMGMAPASDRTLLIEVQQGDIAESTPQPVAAVQCNCACK